MAVIVKYVVVRDGEEKMTFATKKEADAHDKMLDIADRLFDFLDNSDIELDEARQEELCLMMAQRREELMPILRGVSPQKKSGAGKKGIAKKADVSEPADQDGENKPETQKTTRKSPRSTSGKAANSKVAAAEK